MTKKIIGYDPIQKKTTYFHGGNDGQHYVSVEQETKHIIDKAKNLDIDYKPYDLVGSQKHMRQIAEIPANLFFELKTLKFCKHLGSIWLFLLFEVIH